MRVRADFAITALALAVLGVLGLAIDGAQGGPAAPYASTSAASDGTLALYRWVTALGFRPVRLSSGRLRLEGLRALFVLEPQAAFSAADVATTLRWVRQGGTLVLLEDGGDPTLPYALHLSIRPLSGPTGLPFISGRMQYAPTTTAYGAAPVQPLLAHPPLRGLSVTVSAAVYGAGPAVVPILGKGGVRPPDAGPQAHVAGPDARTLVLVYEQVGRGRVYAGSAPAAVTNGLIASGDNRRLVPNLLAGLPRGSRVGFDDYHLVAAEPVPATLDEALTTAGWGRALLYALALIFAYIVLTGRRLGRPLRAVPERGRSLAEYVVSMAALLRRAGLRTRVLALWQDDLRRTLAGPGGRRGRTDADLVAEAARRAGLSAEEQDEALSLLRAREALGEGTLVALCGRIARLQQRLS